MTPQPTVNPWIKYGAVILLTLVFIYGYALPRKHSVEALEQEIVGLESARGDLAKLLPEVSRLRQRVPNPPSADQKIDLRSWIAKNALTGLEKNLTSNDTFAQGAGAAVKLRKMSPAQVVRFMGELTRVNLMLERLVLNDWDGDGRWDLELMVKVPTSK